MKARDNLLPVPGPTPGGTVGPWPSGSRAVKLRGPWRPLLLHPTLWTGSQVLGRHSLA